MDSPRQITNEQKHYLAMWITTLFQTPSLQRIIYEVQSKYQLLSSPSLIFSITELYEELISKQKLTDQIRCFVIGGMLDAGLVHRGNQNNLNKGNRLANKVLKKMRQELQVQFHREKLIYSRKLVQIPPYQLFRQLAQNRTGYLTIGSLRKYVLKYLPDQQLPHENDQALISKFITNIHEESEKSREDQLSNPLLNRIYLENFTELIERINFYEFNGHIGTIQFLKNWIQNWHRFQQSRQLAEQYQHVHKLRKSRDQQVYATQVKEIKSLAQHLTSLNQPDSELQIPAQVIDTNNTQIFAQKNSIPHSLEKLPTKSLKSLTKQKANGLKNSVSNKILTKAHERVQYQDTPINEKEHTKQKSRLAERKYIDKDYYKTQRDDNQETNCVIRRQRTKDQILNNNSYNRTIGVELKRAENHDSRREFREFITLGQQQILQQHQRDLQELLQLSRQERYKNDFLVSEVRAGTQNLTPKAANKQQIYDYPTRYGQQNQENSLMSLNKLTTIKKHNSSEGQKEFQVALLKSSENKPTHRIQPTFGEEIHFGSGQKTRLLLKERNELIRQELEQIKLERVRNRLNMYMYC